MLLSCPTGPCTRKLGPWVWGHSNYSTGFGQVYDHWVLGPLGMLVEVLCCFVLKGRHFDRARGIKCQERRNTTEHKGYFNDKINLSLDEHPMPQAMNLNPKP